MRTIAIILNSPVEPRKTKTTKKPTLKCRNSEKVPEVLGK